MRISPTFIKSEAGSALHETAAGDGLGLSAAAGAADAAESLAAGFGWSVIESRVGVTPMTCASSLSKQNGYFSAFTAISRDGM